MPSVLLSAQQHLTQHFLVLNDSLLMASVKWHFILVLNYSLQTSNFSILFFKIILITILRGLQIHVGMGLAWSQKGGWYTVLQFFFSLLGIGGCALFAVRLHHLGWRQSFDKCL